VAVHALHARAATRLGRADAGVVDEDVELLGRLDHRAG
jgi:hypothetical protein